MSWYRCDGDVFEGKSECDDCVLVVVIDPEDREQAGRLLVDYLTRYDGMKARARAKEVDCLQAALREFANPTPPKPDEPTGLGAVVRDASGRLWVRSGKSYGMPDWRTCGGDDWTEYADIRVTEVLSPGASI